MNIFKGSMVAIVTPMNEDGSLDFNSLKNLIEFHIENQTDVIISVGTTGESATLETNSLGVIVLFSSAFAILIDTNITTINEATNNVTLLKFHILYFPSCCFDILFGDYHIRTFVVRWSNCKVLTRLNLPTIVRFCPTMTNFIR